MIDVSDLIVHVDVPDGVRMAAMREYMLRRRQNLPQDVAFQMVVRMHPHAEAWREEDKWELAFRAAQTASLLNDDALRTDVTLRQLMKRRKEVERIVDDLFDASTTQSDDQYQYARQYLQYSQELDRLIDRIEDAGHKAALRYSEQTALPVWSQRRDEILAQLREAYKGKGPQYDLLIEQVAAAKLVLEQVQASPASLDVGEYAKLNQNLVALINQLQKHTESVKSEAVRTEVQDALVSFMGLIEGMVAPTYPSLWNAIVNEVVRRSGGGHIIEGAAHEALVEVGEYPEDEEDAESPDD